VPVSNQTRHSPVVAVLIASMSLAALVVAAWLASMLWPPAGVLVVVGAFGVCGLTRGRRQRTTSLPRPAAAPLPLREPTQLAA
jgi:hypothetical protein